jgi:hypothetical protein
MNCVILQNRTVSALGVECHFDNSPKYEPDSSGYIRLYIFREARAGAAQLHTDTYFERFTSLTLPRKVSRTISKEIYTGQIRWEMNQRHS